MKLLLVTWQTTRGDSREGEPRLPAVSTSQWFKTGSDRGSSEVTETLTHFQTHIFYLGVCVCVCLSLCDLTHVRVCMLVFIVVFHILLIYMFDWRLDVVVLPFIPTYFYVSISILLWRYCLFMTFSWMWRCTLTCLIYRVSNKHFTDVVI